MALHTLLFAAGRPAMQRNAGLLATLPLFATLALAGCDDDSSALPSADIEEGDVTADVADEDSASEDAADEDSASEDAADEDSASEDAGADATDPPEDSMSDSDASSADTTTDAQSMQGWPTLSPGVPLDPEIEAEIDGWIERMSVEQKVGQIIQPEIQAITPDEVRRYHIGSVLNGGGSWPSGNRQASAADWVALADAYYDASVDASDAAYLPIPVLWGTDAVHGHSNVRGATLFPHNIGLGAANDPDLIERIARVTATEVQVTGIDWTFAPTLAVVRDDRWGRTYEGYAESPEIVAAYGSAMVRGLQGEPGASELLDTSHVLATAKHFIGDGGTVRGIDQGDTQVSEAELIATHAPGYFAAIEAGVQTVMVSFSSWNGEKMHGNTELLTDVLRGPLGFDGLVVGDWNGHGQLPGCSDDDCPAAINAGVDLIMVPFEWRAFYENTVRRVNEGTIPMTRLDEAVRRVLRVKMRAGLLGPSADRGRPSTRALAGRADLLGHPDHRAVAREAVQRSLVILKDDLGVLPLDGASNVLVTGRGADNLTMQSGGWTISWQGTDNGPNDFPGATSIWEGIRAALTEGGGRATLDASGARADEGFDVIVAVIGESPYAEGQGDIGPSDTLRHARRYPEDLALLQRLRDDAPGVPIVTVLLTGRPLYVNPELNRSDAFVAAWLPGSEGGGVSDLLFGAVEPRGRLSYSWPAAPCDTDINGAEGDAPPLFARGFGLAANERGALGNALPEEVSAFGCDVVPGTPADQPLQLFTGGADRGDWVLRIGAPSNWNGIDVGTGAALVGEIEASSVDGRIQGSARRVRWSGTGEIYTDINRRQPGADLSAYAASRSDLVFRVRVNELAATRVSLLTHCQWPCLGEVPLLDALEARRDGRWHEIRVPVACFVGGGLNITNVNRPFLLYAEGVMELDIEDIRWEPSSSTDAADCTSWQEP